MKAAAWSPIKWGWRKNYPCNIQNICYNKDIKAVATGVVDRRECKDLPRLVKVQGRFLLFYRHMLNINVSNVMRNMPKAMRESD